MSASDADAAPESPYQSTGEVDRAVQNYFEGGAGDGDGSGGDGAGAFGEIGESPTLSGSLSAPDEISPASGFEASCRIRNDGEAINGQITLGVAPAEGDPYRLASAQATIDAGGSGTVEFSVPRGTVPAVPGEATLGAISAASGESAGVIATTGTRILGEDEQGEPDLDGWSVPEYIRELPFGWHLYAQFKGENQQRFIIAGKNAEGALIYLTERGEIASSPTYLDTLDAVAAALSAYRDNVEAGSVPEGNQPDPSQSRPTPAELTDAITSQGPLSGGFGGSTLMIVGVLTVAGYILYRRSGGQLPAFGDLSTRQQYAAAGIAAIALYAWSDRL